MVGLKALWVCNGISDLDLWKTRMPMGYMRKMEASCSCICRCCVATHLCQNSVEFSFGGLMDIELLFVFRVYIVASFIFYSFCVFVLFCSIGLSLSSHLFSSLLFFPYLAFSWSLFPLIFADVSFLEQQFLS